MPTISLCMIVRNESESVGRCLDSAFDYCDEIVVVDTGSVDGTASVCASYGARVYRLAWSDDFSAARNYGLERASSDWILWLDADEVLEMADFAALRSELAAAEDDLLPVRLLHFYGAEPADGKRAHVSSGCRLFRNNCGIRFRGRVHEQLEIPSGKLPAPRACTASVRILHYGYMDAPRAEKGSRNIDLLRLERAAAPDDPWLDYHLAAEYYGRADEGAALAAVNASIAGFLKKGLMPPALAYKLKYDLLTTTQSFQSVLAGIDKAIALYPDYVDLHFYKGIAQLRFGQYEKASETFMHCLILGESNPEYLILIGTGSFLALYYLGYSYEKREKYAQAAQCYRQALLLHAGFPQAGLRLAALDRHIRMEDP